MTQRYVPICSLSLLVLTAKFKSADMALCVFYDSTERLVHTITEDQKQEHLSERRVADGKEEGMSFTRYSSDSHHVYPSQEECKHVDLIPELSYLINDAAMVLASI